MIARGINTSKTKYLYRIQEYLYNILINTGNMIYLYNIIDININIHIYIE